MEGTLSDTTIANRLRIAMFQKVMEDRSFIQNYIFTDSVEMYEKAIPEDAPRGYDSPYFYLLVEMKVQVSLHFCDYLSSGLT
jgi:hypothetical protein